VSFATHSTTTVSRPNEKGHVLRSCHGLHCSAGLYSTSLSLWHAESRCAICGSLCLSSPTHPCICHPKLGIFARRQLYWQCRIFRGGGNGFLFPVILTAFILCSSYSVRPCKKETFLFGPTFGCGLVTKNFLM
jgi:hypothetical protein